MEARDWPSARERAQAERAEIEAQLRHRDLPPRRRERLEMVKALALGQDETRIQAWSARSLPRIRYWLERFRQGGVAALSDAPRTGRPPKADATYLTALEQALASSPRDRGLLCDAWTSARLSAYLEEKTGRRIAPGWLRALLARRAYACGRPKHTLTHRQDEAAIAAFTTALAAVGEKAGHHADCGGTALRR